MTKKNIFIVAMHRSGNSLLANWLHSCGLNMGENLIGATFSNVFGHFEDIDFVEYHENLLRYNNNTLYAKLDEPLVYDAYFKAKAKSLLFLRDQLADEWGMKQPRATLFLNLWRLVNPKGHYLIPFRDYKHVVSSLFNRQYKKIALYNKENPEKVKQLQADWMDTKLQKCNDFLSMWIRHNQELLQHITLIEKDRFLLFSIQDLVENDKEMFDYFTEKWNFHLNYVPIKEIFSPNSFHTLLEIEVDSNLETLARSVAEELQNVKDDCLDRLRGRN